MRDISRKPTLARFLLACLVCCVSGAVRAAETPRLFWNAPSGRPAHAVVEVSGLSSSAVAQLSSDEKSGSGLERSLSVRVVQPDIASQISAPAMSGRYELSDGVLRFTPLFPLDPGIVYEAVFRNGDLDPIRASFSVPRTKAGKSTQLVQVYPSADLLPENLLKFYLVFSAPMSRGNVYEFIHLRDDQDKLVELPFLEIDEELWNASHTRLTLFIDPGRIKRGVKPLEDIGPSLEAGKRYVLTIDDRWLDQNGLPMATSYAKTFLVGPPDRSMLDLGDWKLVSPAARSREALRIDFGEPLDHALAQRLIVVQRGDGSSVKGLVTLARDEREFRFEPEAPWDRGSYRVQVRTIIEDLAGNNVGKSFEVDLFEGITRKRTQDAVAMRFEVE